MISIEWLAGFFDGEGCVILTPCSPNGTVKYYGPRLCIAQKDRQLLKDIQADYGGSLHRKGSHDCSSLVWSGGNAIALAEMLLPHTRAKTEQLRVLITAVVKPSRDRAEEAELLKALKRQVDTSE
jgi:hypothetical protein